MGCISEKTNKIGRKPSRRPLSAPWKRFWSPTVAGCWVVACWCVGWKHVSIAGCLHYRLLDACLMAPGAGATAWERVDIRVKIRGGPPNVTDRTQIGCSRALNSVLGERAASSTWPILILPASLLLFSDVLLVAPRPSAELSSRRVARIQRPGHHGLLSRTAAIRARIPTQRSSRAVARDEFTALIGCLHAHVRRRGPHGGERVLAVFVRELRQVQSQTWNRRRVRGRGIGGARV